MDVESADQSEEKWLNQDFGEVIGTVSSGSDDGSDEDDVKDDQHRQEKSPVTEELFRGNSKTDNPCKALCPSTQESSPCE
jgi:hypothetical protein